jgi:hypothetical protein
MNSIKLTAFKNTLVAVAGMVGGAVVTVLFLRFLVDLMKAYDVDPALGLGIVIVTVFAGLAMRLLYKIEVARLEAIDRLNNKAG